MLSLLRTIPMLIGLLLVSHLSYGQDAQFYQCEARVIAFCDSLGAPSQIIPLCTTFLEPCTTYPTSSQFYPNPNGPISFPYNCLYTNHNIIPTRPFNLYAGIIGECSYNRAVQPPPPPPPPPVLTLTVTLAEMAVYPARTSGSALVNVIARFSRSDGGNMQGQTIQFNSTAQELSGGHNHSGGRPSGTFSASSCITDVAGVCTVSFRASEFSGTEKILGFLASQPAVTDAKNLHVKVPGLIDAESLFGVLVGTELRLTGSNSVHPDNHFTTPKNVGNMIGIANAIFELYQATVGFNDMSLPTGGGFDIGPPKWAFWSSSQHSLHREGNSVDVDGCALSAITNNENPQGSCPSGWVSLFKRDLAKICQTNNGWLVNEGPIHCEFS